MDGGTLTIIALSLFLIPDFISCQNVTIEGMSGSFNYPIGDNVTITCRCQPECTRLSLHIRSQTEIKGTNNSTLTYSRPLTREDVNLTYYCKGEFLNSPAKNSIDIYFRIVWIFEVVGIRGPSTVHAGSTLELKCAASNGGSSASGTEYSWQRCTWDPDDCEDLGTTTTNSFRLRKVRMSAMGNYSCKARNEAGYSNFSEPLSVEINDSQASKSGETRFPLMYIIFAVGGGVLLIIFVIIVVVCICQKRKQNNQGEYAEVKHDTGICCCKQEPQMRGVELRGKDVTATNTTQRAAKPRYTPEPGTTGTIADRLKKALQRRSLHGGVQYELEDEVPASRHVIHSNHSYLEPIEGSADHDLYDDRMSTYATEFSFLRKLENGCVIKKLRLIHSEALATVYTANLDGSNMLQADTYLVKYPKDRHNETHNKALWMEVDAIRQAGHHQKIVNFLGYQEQQDSLLLVMPNFEYGTVYQFFLNHRQEDYFTQDHVFSFATDVATALMFLHRCDPVMLHPNLDLNQVYIENSPDGLSCKVGGFLSQTNTNIRQSEKWEENQMELYRAPEIQSRGTHTKMTDTWDFGFFLFQLVTLGELPFIEETEEGIRHFFLSGEVLPQPNCCSDALYALIARCLNHKQGGRPRFKSILKTLASLHDSQEVHVDIEKAQNNLDYENKKVIASISQHGR